MVKNFKQFITESTDDVETDLKKYTSLKQLKTSNPELYKKALNLGMLTKYFPSEVSLPSRVEKSKAEKIYDVLDRMEKNLDSVLKKYGK